MAKCTWCFSNLLTLHDVLFSVFTLIVIALFSILAARAEARMWQAIGRSNGERRALQRQITLAKSHLR